MKQKLNFQQAALLWAACSIIVVWLGILASDCCGEGVKLTEFLSLFSEQLQYPFRLSLNGYTARCVFAALCIYALAIGYYYTSKGNKRTGEEYGSAKWGDAAALNRKYRDKNNNIILSQHISMGLDGRRHKRNLNVIVVGGSGAGKTRGYVLPNIMECNCSYIIADPKGEILRKTGGLLEKEGYEICILNLVDLEKSDCYNPIAYLRSDHDALKLVTNLIKNTNEKGQKSSDPFWDKSEAAILQAFILYLLHEAPASEQNFSTVMYMIENAAASEEDESYKSPVDLLFDDLERKNPEHIALKMYKVFKQAAGKTAKSILVSTAVRLAAFNLPEIARVTEKDEMFLNTIGNRKKAVFAVISDNDTSLNFIVSMLYSQTFQELYHEADRNGGRLPVHVRVMMDEFANVALPENFEKVLATCRGREISINIIIQNMAQIKAMFRDSWENLTGNCDTYIYLGGNESTSHEYISKSLGKETVDVKTRGVTHGRNGSSSNNFQSVGRELLTPDEVRMIDNNYEVVIIRGERAVMDKKFALQKHRNIKFTEDGGAEPYEKREAADYSDVDLHQDFDVDEIEVIEFD
jgi:type IV secretion system protein VirD4